MALILTGMGSALYDLQITNGEDYYQQSQRKIAETEVVEAARGLILDRNGRVLVSNEVIYQIKLNGSQMKDQRNQILLTLTSICRDEGVEWTDTLPISSSQPFVFTRENPYYTDSTDEEGTPVRSLTLLGKLAVNMKWMSDPTAQPKETEEPSEAPAAKTPGLWDRIKAFFTGSDPTPQSSASTKKPSTLPAYLTAEELLGRLCESFSIQGEGAVDRKKAEAAGETVPVLNIGDLDPSDARTLAGVVYEMTLRTKDLTWTPYIFAEEIDIDLISRIKEAGLNGVVIEPTTVRRYHTEYAAHLLGRVGPIFQEEWEHYKNLDEDGDGVPDYQMDDTVGKDGAELAFESYLRGTPGKRTLERSNTTGKILSESWLDEPQPGDNVVLTIDIDLQKKVEDTLATFLPNLESKEVEGAACVILDVDSGGALAAASYPTYSLSSFSEDWSENSSNPLKPLVNRAFNGLYPPGSTFKMVTAIAALENEIITPRTKIRDEGIYTYWSSPQPKCWYFRQYGQKHGLIDVSEAIEVSCNYFFYDVGRRVGIDTLSEYAARFGLGQKTGIELPEKSGAVGSPARSEALGQTWYEGNILNVSIGQDNTQATPLQLANYIATLVNGGTRYSTHLLKEVKSNDFSQILHTYAPTAVETIDIQPENLEAVKAGMLALTTEGSVSRYFKDLPVKVGAKTGSAQVSAQTESNAVFVCFAPYDDPEIAMAIAVEHGGSGSELGAIAAEILSYYFSAQESREDIPSENTLIR